MHLVYPEHLAQYAKALGNDKSEILLRVELELWRALLKVATGRETISTAMQAFYATVDQDEVLSVALEDRQFFSASMSLHALP